MMRNGKTLALALSALTLSNGAQALISDASPYRGIVERNAFDVHPAAPAPPPDPNANRPPPPNIRLQGITDILGRKQVLFKVQLPPKPPAPAKEESFILTVGERQGEIEVLAIDPKAGTVTMRNYGVETNLSLELNSDKLVNVAPVGPPAAPPNPAQMTAPGTLAPPPNMPPTLPAGRFPRTLRLPNSNGAQSNPNAGNSAGASYQASPSQDPPMPIEGQIIAVEAQRLKYRQEGSPLESAMPPPPRFLQKELEQTPTMP